MIISADNTAVGGGNITVSMADIPISAVNTWCDTGIPENDVHLVSTGDIAGLYSTWYVDNGTLTCKFGTYHQLKFDSGTLWVMNTYRNFTISMIYA